MTLIQKADELIEGLARFERTVKRQPGSELNPIPMVLHCPRCKHQHVDKAEPENGWDNPPHKSHKCKACLTIWRPADVHTVGVASITTRGTADTYP